MTLREWLDQSGTTQVVFAARIGVAQSTVARWCAGVMPRPDQLRRIRDLTGGAVTADSFLSPQQAAE